MHPTINYTRWLMAIFLTLFAGLAFSHGMSEAEKQLIIEGGNLHFIWIGATHMLSGYDHLAFVFGIIFFLTKFTDIVKYITAFTVGHSITLIIATFNAIQINYFLIDAVIALSVAYIAFHNLDGFKKYLGVKAPNMLAMIFSLGLIHGLGLSTRLQQLPLDPDHLLMNIISFNIGIELGQIAALAFMLLLISAFRKSHYFPTFSKISNYFLILAGAFLFLMQMHGYEHSAHADEFNITTQVVAPLNNEPKMLQADWTDTIAIVIPARGEIEYKLKMDNKAHFNFAWQSDKGEVFFDFHGEKTGDTSGYFKTFEKGTAASAKGSLTTAFTGTHGWYWKNNHNFPLLITLNVAGDYQRLDFISDKHDTNTKLTHDSID